MRLAPRIAFAALFLSLARFTVPGIATAVREAIELRPLPVEERRVEMFGPFYEGVMKAAATLSPDEPIAFLVGDDFGTGLFMNFYLFPRRTALYADVDSYRAGQDAPERIILAGGEVRFIAYAEARAAEMGTSHVAAPLEPSAETAMQFDIPLVSSGDGPIRDRYTTEAVMVNAGDQEATVTIRMNPAGRVATVTLAPGEMRTWNDLVYQLFSTLDAGWLRVQADQPLRSRFWFVNRAVPDADVLPHATFARSFRIPHRAGSRIWLLNPHDRRLPIRLGEGEHFLDPRTLVPIEWPVDLVVTSEAELYVYQSWRDASGATYFHWPEGS
ncbi:MAG TPA: hypothetical protein VM779_00250 [Thermoanaerobaculia bacterium]|nr:hypothetical protein [Thermoanaerobaculia bacterium]